jgi:hypothetical protein
MQDIAAASKVVSVEDCVWKSWLCVARVWRRWSFTLRFRVFLSTVDGIPLFLTVMLGL